MRLKRAIVLASTVLLTAALYEYAPAILSGGVYRILISEESTIGNSALKTGGAYTLLGSTGQLGLGTLSGGRYTLNWGTVNSWRPPQADVSRAHAFPNPCRISQGCSGVTFTRLTLRATITIYTISGEKVCTVQKDGNLDSVGWDLRNTAGAKVASGLYFYVVTGDGSSKKGKLIIVR